MSVNLKTPYLTEQIITCLGNKRSLLPDINRHIELVKHELKKDKIVSVDLFSGSGIISRLLKMHSSLVIANDLERFSVAINECFLSNLDELNTAEYLKYLDIINQKIETDPIVNGIISTNYAPKDTNNIKEGERCFYTRENAIYIDSFRKYVDELVPKELKKFFLAELITEASICPNTCGVFKGFYKDKETGIGKFGGTAENALTRIMPPIKIKVPVLSSEKTDYKVYMEDAVELSSILPESDLVYLDPPYNQHPYGSNYFMLNLILDNKITGELSQVAGIQQGWNHSVFNKKNEALPAIEKIIRNLNTKYVLVSYNNEGFISYDEMVKMLKKYGDLRITAIEYNTFRGSRNLRSRNIYTSEYLFLLRKKGN